jgi:hypothetical protein
MNKWPLKTDFGRDDAVTFSLLNRQDGGDATLYRYSGGSVTFCLPHPQECPEAAKIEESTIFSKILKKFL